MKTINKIALAQLAYCIGGVICYIMIGCELENIIVTHITATMGYLYGFLHSRD